MSELTLAEIIRIHERVERNCIWTSDRVRYGKAEHWSVPEPDPDGIIRDDCDGIAMRKLHEAQYRACYPAVCQTEQYDWRNRPATGFDHAVAVFEVEGEYYIADNRNPEVVPLRFFRHYGAFFRPVERQNLAGSWISFTPASPSYFLRGPENAL